MQERRDVGNPNTNIFDGKLLGFRSGRSWKKAVAIFYYVIFLIFVLAALGLAISDSIRLRDAIVDTVATLLLLGITISPAVFLSNYGYAKKLPIISKKNQPFGKRPAY